jgi:recombination protein RecA
MSIETFAKAFQKKYKEPLLKASAIVDYKPEIIPICPMLNLALNGGIPEGSRVLIAGKQGVGKSTYSLEIAKHAIKQDRPVFFLPIEGRFREQTVTAVSDLNPDDIHIIGSTENNILYGEDYLSIATQIITDVPRAVVILDSLSFLYPKSQGDDAVSATNRPSQPKMISDFLSKVSNIIPVRKSVLISIAHTYKSQDKYDGETHITKGGNSSQQQADIFLRCTSAVDWKEKDEVIGKLPKWKILKTAIGAPYSGTVDSYLRFGYGVDDVKENFELAKEQGLITQGGAWHYFNFSDGEKFQGEAKALAALRENQEVYDKLLNDIL